MIYNILIWFCQATKRRTTWCVDLEETLIQSTLEWLGLIQSTLECSSFFEQSMLCLVPRRLKCGKRKTRLHSALAIKEYRAMDHGNVYRGRKPKSQSLSNLLERAWVRGRSMLQKTQPHPQNSTTRTFLFCLLWRQKSMSGWNCMIKNNCLHVSWHLWNLVWTVMDFMNMDCTCYLSLQGLCQRWELTTIDPFTSLSLGGTVLPWSTF